MILKDIDFTNFYKHVSDIFSQHFTKKQTAELMDFVYILSDANFRCYRANSIVIETRKTGNDDYKLISEMEWVARNVGEYRVSSKARINLYISKCKSNKEVVRQDVWANDDIVYSVGEMIDRLSIEFIKRKDFMVNYRPLHMVEASQDLSDRVEKYLKVKLKEIGKKGFYECIHEQRTYDLGKIVKELVI